MARKLERRQLTHAEARSIAAFSARDRVRGMPATPQSIAPPLAAAESSGANNNMYGNGSGNVGNKRWSTSSLATVTAGTASGTTATVDDAEATAEAFRRVVPFCRGLRVWAARPCFEARMDVWVPEAEGNGEREGEEALTVVRRKVMGVDRGLAVTDLEFSEALEVLAGLHLDDSAFERALLPPINSGLYHHYSLRLKIINPRSELMLTIFFLFIYFFDSVFGLRFTIYNLRP